MHRQSARGDRIISEYAPDGRTSETVFAVPGQSPGIKVGTSITLLSRSRDSVKPEEKTCIQYRDYARLEPNRRLGLPFRPMAVSEGWFDWPALPDLFPASFRGVKISRDGFLVDGDLTRLKARVAEYFDKALSHEEIVRRYPNVMKTSAGFDVHAVRESLLARGARTKPDSSVSRTVRSTRGGSIGKQRRNCWTRNAPSIAHMSSPGICGFFQPNTYGK